MHNVSFFMIGIRPVSFFFFFNDTATTEIYTLSLHDALPISNSSRRRSPSRRTCAGRRSRGPRRLRRSESGGTAYFPKRVVKGPLAGFHYHTNHGSRMRRPRTPPGRGRDPHPIRSNSH